MGGMDFDYVIDVVAGSKSSCRPIAGYTVQYRPI